jgi:hypothetical protein
MKQAMKRVMSLNLATFVRAARFGPKDAARRLSACYAAIAPFEGMNQAYDNNYSSIPVVELQDIVRSRPIIRVDGLYSYVDGSLPWCDIIALLTILLDRRPESVLEIGTFHGHTTRLLALNLPESVIHTVDLPEDYGNDAGLSLLPKDDFHLIKQRRVGCAYKADSSIKNVVQHFGDTATWDFAQANGSTFFFIDGSHTYEYVRNDTEKVLKLAKELPATLVWHDCDPNHRGVTRWLAEMVSLKHPVKRIRGANLAIMTT